MLIQWHITERCNLRCSHCYQESTPPDDPSLSMLLAVLERISAFAAFLRAGAPGPVPVHITLTGGEPYLHPDFARLLAHVADWCRRDHGSFAILSNGSLLDAAAADALRPLRPAFVQISLEGAETTHDQIRGAGAFQAATRTLRILRSRRIPAYVSFTAHCGNVAEFPAVAAISRDLGVARLWADRMVPLGRGAAGSDRLLSPVETRAFFETMRVERARRSWAKTEIAMHRALQFLAAGGEPYCCSAGDTLLTILPHGDLCPCRRMPLHVGNVLNHPIAELYLESPVLRGLRDRTHTPEACAPCFYSNLCRGGLRCLANAVHGTPFAADPGCWLARCFASQATASPTPASPCATCPSGA